MTPTRITDARAAGLQSISVEYSSAVPFNCDNSHLLLQQNDGFIRRYDSDGHFLNILPGVTSSSEPRWSRDDPNVLVYRSGRALVRYDVRLSSSYDDDQNIVVRDFTEYSVISGLGESDLSEDGDHLALVGDGRYVFVYQISSDRKCPVFAAPPGLNGLYITPDNNVLCGGTTGLDLYDKNGLWLRKIAQTQSHMDVMRDLNGDEVVIRTNAADNPAASKNGIEMIRLADGKVTCLWEIGWPMSHDGKDALAVHISCPDRDFALISTYNTLGRQPSQIFKLPLDGSGPQLLCDTGTLTRQPYANQDAIYAAEPKASISRDGSRFVYCSDKDGAVDTWMVRMDSSNNIPAVIPATPPAQSLGQRIDYAPYVGKSEFVLVPRPDGAVDIYERKL